MEHPTRIQLVDAMSHFALVNWSARMGLVPWVHRIRTVTPHSVADDLCVIPRHHTLPCGASGCPPRQALRR